MRNTRKGNDRYVQLEEEIKGLEADAKNLAIGPTKEQWWLLLRASYYSLEQMDQVKRILERLVVEWSKKEYWVQLSAMYSQDKQETEQIAAYQTAYHEGYLEKSSEFVMMAQLYLSLRKHRMRLQNFFRKLWMMEKLIQMMKKIGWFWHKHGFCLNMTRKPSLPLREAAKLTDDGELDLRLG